MHHIFLIIFFTLRVGSAHLLTSLLQQSTAALLLLIPRVKLVPIVCSLLLEQFGVILRLLFRPAALLLLLALEHWCDESLMLALHCCDRLLLVVRLVHHIFLVRPCVDNLRGLRSGRRVDLHG